MQPKNNFNPKARRQARIFSLQALYQWHMTAQDVSTIEDEFKESERSNATDWPYFQMLFEGVIDHLADVEESFAPLLDRDKTKLDPIELALLRLGTFELLHCQDVPVKVVINEAIELAKMFGATDSFKYVNGILDKLAKQRR